MFLELNREEIALLIRLVEERLCKERFLADEQERASISIGMERDRECWDRILHKLHGCECDVLA